MTRRRRGEGDEATSNSEDASDDAATAAFPSTAKTLVRFRWIARLIPTLELLSVLTVLVGVGALIYLFDKMTSQVKGGGLGGVAIVYAGVVVLGTAVQVIAYRGLAEALRALVEIHARPFENGG